MPSMPSEHHCTDGKDCDTAGTGEGPLAQTVGAGIRWQSERVSREQ